MDEQLFIDAINSDAFNMVSLTNAINLAPVMPGALGKSGLFKQVGISTYTAAIEYQNGRFTILPFGERGVTEGASQGMTNRIVRTLSVPHIPHCTAIHAHEVIGVRAFGKSGATEVFEQKVADHLATHAANHEATWEFHRAGAMCGVVRDANGTSYHNLFTIFGLTEDVYTFNFSAGTEAALHQKALQVKQAVQDSIGVAGFQCEVKALIDDVFFNAMIASPGVRSAWYLFNDQELLRKGYNPGDTVFTWGGIEWQRYNSAFGTVNLFGGTNVARFYPVIPGLYQHIMAPANFMEAVGTLGQPMYSKREVMPLDTGIKLHSQSNPLFVCTRPNALKKGIST